MGVTFAEEPGLLFDRLVEAVPEGGEPVGLELGLDVPVDVVEDLLHVLDGLVYGLLLGHDLLLPAAAQDACLFDQLHHLLLLSRAGHHLLLALAVLQHELAGSGLHLEVGGGPLLLLLVGVVVVLDHQVNVAVDVVDQLLAVVEV